MRQIIRRIPLACLSVFLVCATAAVPAEAQYFGRNKVQYKDFKFEVLKTDHFDIYFYEDERESAARVGRMAERWYARLSSIFEHEMKTRQPLVLYASHPDFEQTNVIGGMIGEGTGGVTEGLKRRVVLPLAGTLAETDHVLGHELVHAFQYDISANRARGGYSGGGIEALPLWFVEGLAEYLSIGPVDPHTAMWLRDATRKEELPQIKDLANGEYFPYRWGQAVWAYMGGKYGDDLVGQIFRAADPLGRCHHCARAIGAGRRKGALDQLARRHPVAIRAGDERDRSRAYVRPFAHVFRQDAHGDECIAIDQP